MTAPILLDTCAALWLLADDPLSKEAVDAINKMIGEPDGICASPMTAWEVAMLVSKGRLTLVTTPRTWFDRLVNKHGLALAPLTPAILIAANELPGGFHKDPVDRILAATARELGYRLMTRDRPLLAYAGDGYLQAIAC